MGMIQVLDESLANRIAAGEVIERPSNVVKELVENSIDANSDSIKIEIIDSGLTEIRITDNGIGMSKEDALLCFQRHATSKIRSDFDLFRISSLGFRGEAIPSIASISRFELKTCQDGVGHLIAYEFGKLVEETFSEAKRGTEITITKLFQNVPARLKYMSTINSEFSKIQGYIENIAIAYPSISFSLYHQSKLVFKSNGNNNLLEVIHNIYGLGVAKQLINVDFSNDEFHISGYISKIELSRSNKNYMNILVNHRVIRNSLVVDTIDAVYRNYLFPNRHPMVFINIEIEPFLVDVNVHPAKLEVRFSKEQALKELLTNGIVEALQGVDLTYQVPQKKETIKKQDVVQSSLDFNHSYHNEEEQEPFESQHIITKTEPLINEALEEYSVDFDIENNLEESQTFETNTSNKVISKQKEMKKKLLVKGQVHGTYIIAEDESGMYIIDQHAAKERVNYEYYVEKFDTLDLSMQDLLVPIILEFPFSEWNYLNERSDMLLEVGITLEPFGTQSFVVKELPIWMKQIDEQFYIEEMLQQILRNQKIDVLSLRKDAIATLSCKASIKGNTYLDTRSMQNIVDELMCCDNPYVCPHGRPTIISYTIYEIEKMFKRIV